MSYNKVIPIALALAAAFESPSTAKAGTLAFADSETPFTVCSPGTSVASCKDYTLRQKPPAGVYSPALVQLTNSRAQTSLSFTTTVPGDRIFITYNAYCDLNYAAASLTIAIMVDGHILRPQSGNSPFCSFAAPGVMASRTATYGVPMPGTHTVNILASVLPPVSQDFPSVYGSLSDSVTRVED